MAGFTPPSVDEIEQEQPKFAPPAPDELDLSQVGTSPYERYKLAVARGATPESYAEIPGLPPAQNPDWDIVREGGAVPGVSAAIKFVGDKIIEPVAAQIMTGLKRATAADVPPQAGKLDLSPAEPGKPMLSLPRLTPEEMSGATTGEKVAAGIGEGLAGVYEGLSTPGAALTLPFAEFKPVQAYFGAQMAAGIPDSLKAISDAKTPEDIARAYTSLTANVGMGALLAHSALKKGVPDASKVQEATEVHGNVRPLQAPAEELPQPEGGAGVQPPAQAPKAKVPLSDEHAKLLAEHMTEDGHTFGKLREGAVMLADHDTGQVIVDPEQFSKWVDNDLKGLSPAKKAEAVKSAFEHEDIHLKTDPDDAEPFWNSLSPFEQYVLKRQYLKGQDPSRFTPTQLGFEAIRNRMERAMGMTRSDFIGLALHERWTAQALDHLAHIVGKIRSLRDAELSANQKAILDKVRDNINAARDAVTAGVGAGAGNQPFTLRKEEEPVAEGMVRLYRGHDGAEGGAYWSTDKTYASRMGSKMESVDIPADQLSDYSVRKLEGSGTPNAFKLPPELTKDSRSIDTEVPIHDLGPAMLRSAEEVFDMSDEEAHKYFTGSVKTQRDGVLWGMEQTPNAVPRLQALRDQAGKKMMEATEKGDGRAMQVWMGKAIWMNGAIEGALNKGPNYTRVMAEKAAAGPAMLRKKGRPGEQEELFGAPITKKGIPGGEEVQPTTAAEAGALPKQYGNYQTTPGKIDFEQLNKKSKTKGELPFRFITPSEAKNPSDILVSNARLEGSDLPVSSSRRLTALFDNQTGEVHLVSTYKGDNKIRMVDPEQAGKERPNRPAEDLIHRYTPIYSILLQEPVQNFHEAFPNLAEFQEKLANPALEEQRMYGTGTEGIPKSTVEGGETGFQFPREREPNLPRPSEGELQAFHDFFGDTLPSDRTMFEKKLLQSSGKANRRMIAGLEKLMDIQKAQNRGWTDRMALDQVLDDLYENITRSETRSDFVKRTMAQSRLSPAEADAKIKLYLARLEQQSRSGARELTAAEFQGPRKPPTGTGVEPTEAVKPVPMEMLSPEERAFVQRQINVSGEHPPRLSSTIYAQLTQRQVPKKRYSMLEQKAKFEEGEPLLEEGEEGAQPVQSELMPERQMMSEKPEEELQHEEGEDLVTKAVREQQGRTKGESGMRKALEKAESAKRQGKLDIGQPGLFGPETGGYEFEQHRLSREIRELRQKLSTAVDSDKPGIREDIMRRVVEYENKYGELPWGEGPAMLRKVEDTTKKLKDYLRITGEKVKAAGNLSDQLYRLKTSEKADYDLALPVIKSALKIIPEADRPKLLQYSDEMQVLKKSDIKLTDAQQTMYETFLKPLLDDNQKMYRSLMRAGIPVGESTYLGRMVQDTHSLYNRLWRGTKQRITEGSLLGQGASFFKRRVFKALESPDGTRRLIALVGDGKDTRVIGYDKGKAELLGKMPPESLEPKPLSPQQIRTQRIVEARRLQELDKLDKEEAALLKEKDRLSKDPNADPVQVKGVDDRLASINGDYAEVGEKYPSPVFDVPRMWKDKNGNTWKFTDATINEIEKNTNTRYYQEPMSGIITQNLKLKQIYRANQFLEDLKNSPDFQRISRSVNERNVPADWRTVDLPQFRGLRIEPRTADVLDLFSQESRGPSLPMQYVTKLTNFLRNSLFVWNPFVHEPNLLAHWFTARGIEWGKPMGYDRMVRSGVAALNDVLTRSRFRDQALRAGAPLMRGMGKINEQVLRLLQKELDPNPTLFTRIARGLGYINPLRMIRAFGDSLTWGTNEVLTLQLIRETMDRTGLPLEEAISEVGKHMPNYRIPPRVLNSRLIAHVMRNPLLTLWGHYHYGALRSYGEMGKEIFSPKSTMGQRMEGLGRVATIGFLMAVAYPVIDDIVNKILKTKGLKTRRAGSTTFPQGVLDVARGKKTPEALVQSVLTPSPVTQGAFELAFNRNLRTGLPVYERRLGTDTLKDLGSFAANKISPVEEAGRVFGGKKSAQEFGLGLAGITRTRADSAMSRFGRMADNWMRTNPDEDIREQYKRRTQDVFQESDYQLLRSAIIREDNRAAQLAVNKLLKTRKPEEVARRIKQWQDSPFTGTRKTDRALMEEMTPKDWDLWYQAAQERLDIADGMRNALVDALVKPKQGQE